MIFVKKNTNPLGDVYYTDEHWYLTENLEITLFDRKRSIEVWGWRNPITKRVYSAQKAAYKKFLANIDNLCNETEKLLRQELKITSERDHHFLAPLHLKITPNGECFMLFVAMRGNTARHPGYLVTFWPKVVLQSEDAYMKSLLE